MILFSKKSLNISNTFDMSEKKCGIILIHGWAISFPTGLLTKSFVTSSMFGLGLQNCIIKEPKAPKQPLSVVPLSSKAQALGLNLTRSWFDFNDLPSVCVNSEDGAESKEGLQEALGWVEKEIKDLIDCGVPSSNIIILGYSQGGALTLYTAVHTKYKLGGFIPFATWLPLLRAEPITAARTPINKHTPILQLHGYLDTVVPYTPAATMTNIEMNKVFSNYQFEIIALADHFTTLNPVTIPLIRRWITDNVQFS